MAARDRVEALDGAPLHRTTTDWSGFFEGSVSVENVDEQAGVIRFELLLPTSASDIDDYIWRDERERGTTDKIVLSQGGRPVQGARVVAIAREGKSERWTAAETERYRLTFEVPSAAIAPNEPLEVRVQWPDHESDQPVDHAIARGG